jgi:hypothetical protein
MDFPISKFVIWTQLDEFPGIHFPSKHVSFSVTGLPSSQEKPFGFIVWGGQVPVDVLHAPISWQVSLGAQTTIAPPVHTPAWQVSIVVQALPSLHVDPFSFFGFEHCPVWLSQIPTLWH